MPFSAEEHALLLAIKGVGSMVITRLEQLGFSSLTQLSQANALDIVEMASDMLGSTCWKNSPQARAAIQSAITLAQSRQA